MFRSFWQNSVSFNWRLGFLLILLLGIPRFIIVLQANVTSNYQLIPVIFITMIFTPFIFLNREGRRAIGLKKPANYYWLPLSFLSGMLFCSAMYATADFLFQHTFDNWFVYISKSYAASKMPIRESERLTYFIIYSMIGMTLSPIGEEIFYRGIVHKCFAVNVGDKKASILDSLAFAFTHLAHFGIVYLSGDWDFLCLPAMIWLLFMFLASRLFFVCLQKTGSLSGAILCHSGYNLAMMYFIFYHIL